MNYLAHIYLSFGDEELTVGNFITDSLRGSDTAGYSEGVQNGIRLHRKIDVFADTHPVFLKSKRRFSEAFDKYSGILVDIYYDYFLAKNFSLYSPVPLAQYSSGQYALLQKYHSLFPVNAQRFFHYMVERDILFEYSRISSIELVLKQLSSRLRHPCSLHDSIAVFTVQEKEMEQEFFEFFKELEAYSRLQVGLLT
jgi:acyl carrier protein phosphodiesterase